MCKKRPSTALEVVMARHEKYLIVGLSLHKSKLTRSSHVKDFAAAFLTRDTSLY